MVIFVLFIVFDNFFKVALVYACLLLWNTNVISQISIKNLITYPMRSQIHILTDTLYLRSSMAFCQTFWKIPFACQKDRNWSHCVFFLRIRRPFSLKKTETKVKVSNFCPKDIFTAQHVNHFFESLAFPTIFCPFKIYLSGNTVWPQPKLAIFGFFEELLASQKLAFHFKKK